MVQFNNQTAANKWKALQASAGPSLTAIVQGRGTAADFQRVQNILNQQGGLAAQVFAQAVSSAEVQAKKFVAAYQQVVAQRQNEDLTAFELALNEQLALIAPNIVSEIREIIEMSVLQSNEDLTRTMGSRFDHVIQLLPSKRDNPSVDDLLAANDLLAERLAAEENARWNEREPRLLEKIALTFETTLRNLADRINRERAQRYQGTPTAPTPQLPAPQAPTVLQRAMPLLGGPQPSRTTALVSAQAGEASTAVVNVGVQTQRDLTTAAKEQTSLYDRLKRLIPSFSLLRKTGTQQSADDEQEKADTWWRSFKNWFGDKKDRMKKWGAENAGWLSSLGTLLSLAVLNPQLFKTLGEQIQKYLTWDNLKNAVTTAWDWLAKNSETAIDEVLKFLGIKGGSAEKAQEAVKTQTPLGTIQHFMDKKDEQGKERSLGSRFMDFFVSPDERKGIRELGTAISTDFQKGTLANTNEWLGQALFGEKNAQGGYTMFKNLPWYGDLTIGGNKTSVVNQQAPSGSTNAITSKAPIPLKMPDTTTSFDPAKLSTRPGVTTPPAGAAPLPEGPVPSTQSQRGALQMGIHSYGFTASNSDALTLMNVPYIAAG
jgi:hypothetical protein